MALAHWFSLFRQTISLWTAHKSQRLGAALAYYAIFSLAPLLIIFITIIGFVYGQQQAQSQLMDQLRGMVGLQGAELIGTMISNARRSNSDVVATAIGIGTLLLGALGVFGQLQDAINTIWDVKRPQGHGLFRLVRDRLVSLAMVLGIGLLMLVTLIASTALVVLSQYFNTLLPVPAAGLEVLNLLLSFVLGVLLFALLFKFLPDCQVNWSDVWHGAILTSLLFTVGRFLIAWYLGTTSMTSVYGTAGSLVALLVFIYYSAQIILFGAEFTHVYALRDRGAKGIKENTPHV